MKTKIIEDFIIKVFDTEIAKKEPPPPSTEIIIRLLTLTRDGGEQALKSFDIAEKIQDKKELSDEEIEFILNKVKKNHLGYPDFALGQVIKYLRSL